MTVAEYNRLAEQIIGAAIEVHKYLGPGLFEQAYQVALMHELSLCGIKAQTEVEIPLIYKGVKTNLSYRADIIVENAIILELKSTENNDPIFRKQLHTYLRLSNKKLGLVINFNNTFLRDGLSRVVNELYDPAPS